MADIRNLRKTDNYKNYVSTFTAVNKTGEYLEPFTEIGLSAVHQQIIQRLGVLPNCNKQCSQQIRNFNRWCHTCKCWRRELITFSTNPLTIKWTKMKSWEWPHHCRKLAEVFLLPGWSKTNINLQDISTILNIWINCSEFPRPIVNLSGPLTRCRNNLVHNNMELTQNEKTPIFQYIRNLINHPDIRQTIANHVHVLAMMTDLEQNKLYEYEDEMREALQTIEDNQQIIQTLVDKARIIESEMNAVRNQTFRFSFGIIIAIVCALLIIPLSKVDVSQKEVDITTPGSFEGCISEKPHHMFKGDIALLGYLSLHRNLFGRQWLFPKLERHLLTIDGTYHGVMLLAEMGYGKSAIIAHLICAGKNDSGHGIRKQLVAYHVCRFDVMKTKRVDIFIRRMVSMISKRLPVFKSIVETEEICRSYFEKDECQGDQNGCFDQCLLFPLTRINYTDSEPLLILIDAIDECEDTFNGDNRLLHLLKHRLYTLPNWIKLLITSRNITKYYDLNSDVLTIYLESDDVNNKADIAMFVNHHIQDSYPIEKIVKDANIKNFQLIMSIIVDGNVSDVDFKNIPHSLNRAYEFQFERVFGEHFVEAQTIFEIMCTSLNPVTQTELWDILSSTYIIGKETFIKTLQQLSHFVVIVNNELHVVHVSLRRWLESSHNVRFKISIETGHFRNALFLFNKLKSRAFNIDVVNLAVHTTTANSEELITQFNSISSDIAVELELYHDTYVLHRLASSIDDLMICKLLLNIFRDVDRRNKHNLTASYIAASLGHVHTLDCFLENGSNVNFRVEGIPKSINLDMAIQISIKHSHWGYGLLDIAAQRGHIEVVKYIVEKHIFTYQFEKLNDANLLPIHLACKFGQRAVVVLLGDQFRWMLDKQCLYYASEAADIELVKHILVGGITDDCRQCDENLYWISNNSTRVQGRKVLPFKGAIGDNINYVLFDDWSFIACETALHVAVRKNNIDVVKLLTSHTDNALQCHDRGGRTPLIAAVQYNFTEIVKTIVLSNGYNTKEICKMPPAITDLEHLNRKEITELSTYFCDSSTLLSHIIAKFDRLWFVDILEASTTDINWRERDSLGCYPAHYAACHGSVNVLNYWIRTINMTFSNLTCFNGSVPMHSAVACASVESVRFLLDTVTENKTENYIKNILHAVTRDTGGAYATESNHAQEMSSQILDLLNTCEHDLAFRDIADRNILHHAIANGQYLVISDLYRKYPAMSKQLLLQRDAFGKTPLVFSIEGLSKRQSWRFYVSSLFLPGNASEINIMSPHEYSVFLTLRFLKETLPPHIILSDRMVNTLIRKLCYPLVSSYFKTINPPQHISETAIFLSLMIDMDPSGFIALDHVIHLFMPPINNILELIARHFDMNANKMVCDRPLRYSVYHLIALHFVKLTRVTNRLPYFDMLASKIIVNQFKLLPKSMLNDCNDSDGFNILERAIQGGSHVLVKNLLALGIKSKRKIQDVLDMTIRPFSYISSDRFTIELKDIDETMLELSMNKAKLLDLWWKREYAMLYDNVTSQIIKTHRKYISKKHLCLLNARKLSFVHFIAIQCMPETMKMIITYWGTSVLECSNFDKFTPLYLAYMFNNSEIVSIIESEHIELVLPSEIPEFHFLLKIESRFSLTYIKHNQLMCIFEFSTRIPSNIGKAVKAFNCSKKAVRILNLRNNEIWSSTTDEFQWRLIFLLNFDIVTKMYRYLYNIFINLGFSFDTVTHIKLLYASMLSMFDKFPLASNACNLLSRAIGRIRFYEKMKLEKYKNANGVCNKRLNMLRQCSSGLSTCSITNSAITECLEFVLRFSTNQVIRHGYLKKISKEISRLKSELALDRILRFYCKNCEFFLTRMDLFKRYLKHFVSDVCWRDFIMYSYMDSVGDLMAYHDTFMHTEVQLNIQLYIKADLDTQKTYNERIRKATEIMEEYLKSEHSRH